MFALQVICRLLTIIEDISPEQKRIPDDKHFITDLKGALVCIRDSLARIGNGPMGADEVKLIKALLDDLEKLVIKVRVESSLYPGVFLGSTQ